MIDVQFEIDFKEEQRMRRNMNNIWVGRQHASDSNAAEAVMPILVN